MAFKFSMGAAKGLNAKAKEEDEAKAREEKSALDKVLADFEEEHGGQDGVLGEPEREPQEDLFVPTGNKRHFTGRQRSMKSGPGTLDSDPLDSFSRPGRLAPQAQNRFGASIPTGPASYENIKQKDNVFSTLVAKASNLPPRMDTSRLKELFSEFSSLKITNIEKLYPERGSRRRPTDAAKIIFDKEANARDLDDAMNKLNDKKYLGQGYYLHLDRYLGGRVVETNTGTHPFAGTLQAPEIPKGFAPPPDLGGGSRDRAREGNEQLIVSANPPPDLRTLRLVHQTIESVILGGVEFEAALMNDPIVQEEERFAWLYDSRHPVNRYYRWRMHQLVCDSPNAEIFYGQGNWRGPTDPLDDEFADNLGAFDPNSDDGSSDEEDEKPKLQHKTLPVGENYPGRDDSGHGIMSPRSRAMFLWLITSLPPGTIVADDIAAISVFAVDHAAAGMDEVVHILVSNIIAPFQLSEANSRYDASDTDGKDDARRPDVRQVTLNALRILSDVLLVTSKEGGSSYKYRLAIGTQLVERKVMEHLEQFPVQLGMGRMTTNGYRDEVNLILKAWQEERIFDDATLNHFETAFNAREKQKEEEEQARKMEERRKRKHATQPKSVASEKPRADDKEGEPKSEINDEAADVGAPDGPSEPRETSNSPANIDHPPMPVTGEENKSQPGKDIEAVEIPGESAAARARRLRPKAEDMFAPGA